MVATGRARLGGGVFAPNLLPSSRACAGSVWMPYVRRTGERSRLWMLYPSLRRLRLRLP